jgi:hypothetical protein
MAEGGSKERKQRKQRRKHKTHFTSAVRHAGATRRGWCYFEVERD